MNDKLNSGLSFSEELYNSTLEKEIEMGLVPKDFSPQKKLQEIKDRIKWKADLGYSETAIRSYFLDAKTRENVLINESLYKETYNCVAETALFLSLAEILDYDLFRNCQVGHVHNWHTIAPKLAKEGEILSGHVFIIKKSGNETQNIDFGLRYSEKYYKERFLEKPEIKPKKHLISSSLDNCGMRLILKERVEEALSFFDKALHYDPKNFYALKRKAIALEKLGDNEGYKKNMKSFILESLAR